MGRSSATSSTFRGELYLDALVVARGSRDADHVRNDPGLPRSCPRAPGASVISGQRVRPRADRPPWCRVRKWRHVILRPATSTPSTNTRGATWRGYQPPAPSTRSSASTVCSGWVLFRLSTVAAAAAAATAAAVAAAPAASQHCHHFRWIPFQSELVQTRGTGGLARSHPVDTGQRRPRSKDRQTAAR
jgi:hypothetical protein